ncbi:MAG TPA: hypothetical protein VGX78_16530 [Pirellulales bacterium]|jgi:hypothetical protein|nr:hypothetical protein [Pirellulales bacterium]
MGAIRIRKTVDSETLHLPELKPLAGQTVEITISPGPDPGTRAAFHDLPRQLPEFAAAWSQRQATLRGWRMDSCFEPYWPVIDHMLTVDFASFQQLAAVGDRAPDLEGNDDAAWREQREYDLKHAHDHLMP